MSNNKIILNGCIEKFKQENELPSNDSEAFELFAMTQLTKVNDLAFEDIQNSIVDGSNDGGIDSFLIIVNDFIPETIEDLDEIKFSRKTLVTIILSQCKKENSFKESTIDKLITSLPELFNLERSEDALLVRFNPDVVDKVLIAREVWKKCTIAGGQLTVSFNYCSFAEKVEINQAFISKADQLKAIASRLFVGARIDYTNFSSEELLRLYQTQKSLRLSLTFKENPLSTSYESFGIGYVGTVKLGEYKAFLKDIDDTIREDLFESNIRHYQGSVDVNEKIRVTIEDPSDEDFWWLNNGITIIADNPSLVGTTLSIDNVQIVNGLQTSYSIFLHHNGNSEDSRSVLVKVVINDNKTTIDHIIASTNSQNPVSPSLLRATDDVQREIELFFQNEGFFYDRRKNYYKNQGKPAAKIFGIQTNAQAIEAIVFSNPHITRSKPTSLIKDDAAYNRIFNQGYNYRVYLLCCLIAQKSAEYYRTIQDTAIRNKLSNFKLHLARVATSFLLGKSTTSIQDIISIDITDYNQEIFDQAKDLINVAIEDYLTANTGANLINMAKIKQFTDFLLAKLGENFTC
ncbi:AIPR family protein [Rufibacter immobilis]|uniref:AIPR family protein n=1 Tax=Rufibacter immobilis TaxID=1348778 RepID=UPI0035F02189